MERSFSACRNPNLEWRRHAGWQLNWTAVLTNPFNPDGTFDYTNAIVPGTRQQYIDVLAVP